MLIKIFWDQNAPRGLESAVERRIHSILGSPLEVVESCILLSGYSREQFPQAWALPQTGGS
jgi:hypothetical protein